MITKQFVIVLENVRSAYNVGSVLRTADALGSDWEVVLVGLTPPAMHPKVVKTSLGAEQCVSVQSIRTWEEALEQLTATGYHLFAVEALDDSVSYTSCTFPKKSAFIFGNEVRGVTLPVLHDVEKTISIPMRGRKTSLNVATSVGVIAFEVMRQQHG